MRQNFYNIIEKNRPLDKPAIQDDYRSVSYTDLFRYCDNFSVYLLNRGISIGDRIGIFLPNSAEFGIILFSCLKTGAVAVPINPKFRKNEIDYYIKDSRPKIIFTSDSLRKYLEKLNILKSDEIISVRGGLKDVEIFNIGQPESNNPAVHDSFCIAIHLYSTGSTGIPKRISRTHKNLISLAINHSSTIGWSPSEKILFTLPISHTYALGNFIASIYTGMTCYLQEDFNRRKVAEIIKTNGITIYPAVPFILKVLSESNINREAFSSLKMIISAGSALSTEIFNKFVDKFGIYPRQLYGSSETGVISINLDEDVSSSAESVGRPVNEVIVKIINDNDEEVETGELGEITVKSPAMATGYDNMPEETQKVFKNGYYHTGDLGYKEINGNIYIKGRIKLLINANGNKVDPLEIEELLNSHPKISESAVTGSIDESGNEIVKCYIVSNDAAISKVEIINYLKDVIADYKLPKSIVFTDSIPKSPTGKILRKALM